MLRFALNFISYLSPVLRPAPQRHSLISRNSPAALFGQYKRGMDNTHHISSFFPFSQQISTQVVLHISLLLLLFNVACDSFHNMRSTLLFLSSKFEAFEPKEREQCRLTIRPELSAFDLFR